MTLNIEQKRLDELRRLWWDETCEPETQEWRDDLTPSEEKFVESWDHAYNLGVKSLCEQILHHERVIATRMHTPELQDG